MGHDPLVRPGHGVFHGHDGVRDLFRQWRDFFAEYYAEPEEFIDAGDCVIVRIKQRVEIYRERAEALEAAGLLE